MGRVKGDGKGKTGGRKAGTPNKAGRDAKEIIAEIVNDNAAEARKKLNMLDDPKDWIYAYMKLCEFVVPKKAAVQVSADGSKADLKSEIEDMMNNEI